MLGFWGTVRHGWILLHYYYYSYLIPPTFCFFIWDVGTLGGRERARAEVQLAGQLFLLFCLLVILWRLHCVRVGHHITTGYS